jgi:hypothetical protein
VGNRWRGNSRRRESTSREWRTRRLRGFVYSGGRSKRRPYEPKFNSDTTTNPNPREQTLERFVKWLAGAGAGGVSLKLLLSGFGPSAFAELLQGFQNFLAVQLGFADAEAEDLAEFG